MIALKRNKSIERRHTSRTRKAVRRACTALGISAFLTLPMFGTPAFATQGDGFPTTSSCAAGQFCYWADENYPGKAQVLDLSTAETSVCIPLPEGAEARSFVNFREKEITLYEGGHCSTEGDFRTYPGNGTYVPAASFVVRAVEIWS